MNTPIEKNILDLEFQKYLMLTSTSIILAFTYIIGVCIAFISNQTGNISALISASSVILSICIITFYLSYSKLNKIKYNIRNLKNY